MITKVDAASQGSDTAREWIQKLKRDPDFDKYDSPDGFEALDIKLAAALKGVPPQPLRVIVAAKEKALDQTMGLPLRGKQILCVIND